MTVPHPAKTSPARGNHIYLIGTLGFGFALAVLLDALFGAGGDADSMKKPIPVQEKLESMDKNQKKTRTTKPESIQVLDSYVDNYKKKQERKKLREEKAILEGINANAYLGDGTKSSRRLYLIQQAYKASREAAPVVNMKSPYHDDQNALNELLEEFAYEEDDDDDDVDVDDELAELASIASNEVVLPGEEKKKKEIQQGKAIEFTKEEWEAKDKELLHQYSPMVSSSY